MKKLFVVKNCPRCEYDGVNNGAAETITLTYFDLDFIALLWILYIEVRALNINPSNVKLKSN